MDSFDESVSVSERLTAAGIENEIIQLLNCNSLQELIENLGDNATFIIVLNENGSCKYLIIVQHN